MYTLLLTHPSDGTGDQIYSRVIQRLTWLWQTRTPDAKTSVVYHLAGMTHYGDEEGSVPDTQLHQALVHLFDGYMITEHCNHTNSFGILLMDYVTPFMPVNMCISLLHSNKPFLSIFSLYIKFIDV